LDFVSEKTGFSIEAIAEEEGIQWDIMTYAPPSYDECRKTYDLLLFKERKDMHMVDKINIFTMK
jgi:hypothetical protein